MNTTPNDAVKLKCCKTFHEIPFAHRQPQHPGDCSRLHGHNWTIELIFSAYELDSYGYIIDLSDLSCIRNWIESHLNHACVIESDDPLLPYLKALPSDMIKLHILPSASCEGISKHIWSELTECLQHHGLDHVYITSVKVSENSKNSAVYINPLPLNE